MSVPGGKSNLPLMRSHVIQEEMPNKKAGLNTLKLAVEQLGSTDSLLRKGKSCEYIVQVKCTLYYYPGARGPLY